MTLEAIAPGVWTTHTPQRLLGLELGSRMTVVRLADGSLLLHSPVPIDEALGAEIDALGPVSHLVAPNLYHHLHFKEAAARYPEAKRHGVPKLRKKRQDIDFHAELGEPDAQLDQEFVPVRIEGSLLGETVQFHRPTATLLSADLLENFPEGGPWLTRTYLRVGGIYGKPGLHPSLRLMYRDRKAARRSLDEILEFPTERVSLSHGRPLTRDARDTLRATYAWLGP